MTAPTQRRPPTAAEAFFRTGFGCASAIVFKIAVIVILVFVLDWRGQQRAAKRDAEREAEQVARAATSETAARLADKFAKVTDTDGRFVRKPEGPLAESDEWGRPFRLAYRQHTLTDELEVRSAGPDGEWKNHDDVIVTRESKITNKAITRDAAEGLLDAAKKRLGKKQTDAEKK